MTGHATLKGLLIIASISMITTAFSTVTPTKHMQVKARYKNNSIQASIAYFSDKMPQLVISNGFYRSGRCIPASGTNLLMESADTMVAQNGQFRVRNYDWVSRQALQKLLDPTTIKQQCMVVAVYAGADKERQHVLCSKAMPMTQFVNSQTSEEYYYKAYMSENGGCHF